METLDPVRLKAAVADATVGPLSLLAKAWEPLKENLVVRKIAATITAISTRRAPPKLKPDRSARETNEPRRPPAGSAHRTSGKGMRDSREGSDNSNSA